MIFKYDSAPANSNLGFSGAGMYIKKEVFKYKAPFGVFSNLILNGTSYLKNAGVKR